MDIVEHVARAIDPGAWENWDHWAPASPNAKIENSPALTRSLELSRAAIKATLEHLRDNVSSEMELAGLKAGNFVNDGEAMKSEFRAMIEQALKELDA